MSRLGLSKHQEEVRRKRLGDKLPAEEKAAHELHDLEQEIALLKRQQAAMQSRDDFLRFVQFTSPDPANVNDVDRSTYQAALHHVGIARAIEKVENGEYPFLILTVPPRHGKALEVSTPIPTPTGWARIGDLKPGDEVFGADGRPTAVVAVSDVWRNRPVYKVTTGSAGDDILADAEHEWLVRACRKRPGVYKTKTTAWLAKPRKDPRGYRARRTAPLALPDVCLPVPPYTLGVWLGDGCSGHATITAADEDAPFTRGCVEAEGVRTSDRATKCTFGLLGVWAEVRALMPPGGKRIPVEYLRAGEDQRRALLQGLVDTDGHVAPDGQVEFCSTNFDLARGVKELVASLGGKASLITGRATLNGRDCGPKWRVMFYLAGAARLPRKAERCRATVRTPDHYLRAEPFGTADTVCIQVAAPDSLFLAGPGMVPTHNSELVSRRLPAWFMGRHPEQNVVVATYNDDFAADFGAEVRRIMRTPQYRQVFPGTNLVRGGGAKDRLQTTRGGQANFVGRGGSLTGRGAHMLIIDDLIKDAAEASSKTIRDQAWEWFTKVAMTRRMGHKSVIMTFTRWHSDDPIGRLTDPENKCYNRKLAEKIKIINLPAIAEDDDPLGRAPGEPLWPDWYGLDFLEEQRDLDPMGFASLYQQRPTVEDGVLFRRENVRFYDPADLPDNLRFYCASDHAVSTKERADSTVLIKAAVDERGHIYLTDCFWKKAPADEVTEAMLAMGTNATAPLAWWAERGHISKSIGPFLRKRMAETGRFFNVVEVTPAADKEQRAQAIAARMAMGYVHFPRNAWWTEKAITQLLAFPNGLHDDFVDALAYIGLGLRNQISASAPMRVEKSPKFGTLGWVKQAQKAADRDAARAAAGSFL